MMLPISRRGEEVCRKTRIGFHKSWPSRSVRKYGLGCAGGVRGTIQFSEKFTLDLMAGEGSSKGF